MEGIINNTLNNTNVPVTVLWDFENCPPPSTKNPRYLNGTTLVQRLRRAFLKLGPIKEIKAFANVATITPEMREELQTSAVTVIDAISIEKRKDLVDKMIFCHMFSFALDHPAPCTIVLISGDVDYALPLAALNMRHYKIVLVLPPKRAINPKLLGVADHIFHWEDILYPEQLTATVPKSNTKISDDNTNIGLPTIKVQNTQPINSPPSTEPKLNITSQARTTKEKSQLRNNLNSNAAPDLFFSDPQPIILHKTTTKTETTTPVINLLVPEEPEKWVVPTAIPEDGSTPKIKIKKEKKHKNNSPQAPNIIPVNNHDTSQQHIDKSQKEKKQNIVDINFFEEDFSKTTKKKGNVGKSPSPVVDSESDSEDAASISEFAAKVHVQDLIDAIIELHNEGDSSPLITKVGCKLKERYPQLFFKGCATRLANEAARLNLVKVVGNPPQRRVSYDPKALKAYLELARSRDIEGDDDMFF